MEHSDLTPENFLKCVRYSSNENGHSWWYVRLVKKPPEEQAFDLDTLADATIFYCNIDLPVGTLRRPAWDGLEILWRQVAKVAPQMDGPLYFMRKCEEPEWLKDKLVQ